MSERLNKTSICCIVFLDIVAYSQKSDSEQLAYKNRFNQLLGDAVKDIAQNDRIILDTGDGAAIAMMGSPEDAVFVSMTIRDGILEGNREHPEAPLFVRIGINLGPVRVVKDINGQMSIIGDGINVAQRIMSFAEPNHILVSRSYYEIVSRLSDELTQIFTYSGIKHDKHVREHEVYAIRQVSEVAASDAMEDEASDNSIAKPNALRPMRTRLAIGGGLALLIAGGLMMSGAKSPSKLPSSVTAQPAVTTETTSNSISEHAASQISQASSDKQSATVKSDAIKPSKSQGKHGSTGYKGHDDGKPTSSERPKATPVSISQSSTATSNSELNRGPAKPAVQHHPTKNSSKQDDDCSSAMRSLNQCH